MLSPNRNSESVYQREGGSLLAGGGGYVEKALSESLGTALQRWLNLGGNSEATKPYIENPWVHACLSLYAESFAGVPFKVWRSDDDDAPEVDNPDDPVVRLFSQPHPLMDGTALHESLVSYFLHDGETFWFFERPLDGRYMPELIHPMPGGCVHDEHPETDEDGKRKGLIWKFNSGKAEIRKRPEETLRFTRHNPYSFRGVGIVTALARTINNYFQAERFDDAILKNGGNPGSIFSTDAQLNETQARENQKRIKEKMRPENRGEPLVLGAGLSGEILAWSPQDMEFREMRQWLKDTTLELFRVPPVMLGGEADSGFSRSGEEEKRRMFHHDSVAPHMRRFERAINDGLIKKLPAPYSGYRVGYDDSELLEDTLDTHIERTKTIVDMGIPFNTAAPLAGWDIDPVEGGDEVPNAMPFGAEGASGAPSSTPDQASVGRFTSKATPSPDVEADSDASPSTPTRAEKAKRFDEGLIPYDKELARAIDGVFQEYVTETQLKLATYAALAPKKAHSHHAEFMPDGTAKQYIPSEAELESVLPDLEEFRKSMEGALDVPLTSVFVAQVRQFTEEYGLERLVEATDVETASFLLQKRLELAEGITSTLSGRVKSVLISTLADVESPLSLADAIERTLEENLDKLKEMRLSLPDRAQLIARTETTAIANGGRVLAMTRNGITEHEWAHAGDGATNPNARDNHADLDGTVRTVGQEFGFGLRWPGDPSADVSQIANCRCTTIPRIPE